jgi:hypothetical protein
VHITSGVGEPTGFEARGFKTEHVADIGLAAASDLAIANYAEVHGLKRIE